MPAILDQPNNINFLSPLGFRFKLKRSPNLNFFVQDVTLPNISLGFIELPTPFKVVNLAGNKLDYGDFNMSFRLDEDMETYFEIYEWLMALGFPEGFNQYKGLSKNKPGNVKTFTSDATLTIMTSAMVPNIEVDFEDLFPTSISDISFTTQDADVNYITASVSFKYKIFHVKRM
jgi:hypothetical protein